MKYDISNRDRELLGHILEECRFLGVTFSKTSRNEFLDNEVLKRAFARSLEIIGEAAKKVSVEFKEASTDVEWRRISGTRDRIIHDYLGVDYELVWDIVLSKIPPLKDQLENLTGPRSGFDTPPPADTQPSLFVP